MALNWGLLLNQPSIGEQFAAGFQEGRVLRREQDQRQALSVLAKTPGDQSALSVLARVNPELAWKYQAHQRDQAEYDRGVQYRAAQADYTRPRTTNVFNGAPGAQPPGPSVLSPAVAGSAPVAPLGAPGSRVLAAPASPPGGSPPGSRPVPPLAPLADPTEPATDPREAAWQRMVAADPTAAYKFRDMQAAAEASHMKNIRDRIVFMGDVMGSATDPASYQRARDYLMQHGLEEEHLPEQYDPSAVAHFRQMALSEKERIEASLSERKFDWQQQDDRIDNARDDRRVNIQDRAARDASARGWSADRRAERRYKRGDGASLSDASTSDLLQMLGTQ